MNTTTRKRAALVGSLVALALAATACGSDSKSSGATTTAGGATTTAASGATTSAGGATTTASGGGELPAECTDAKATLNASGATFPQAFYEEAIAAFKEEVPGVTINYGGGGSGKGRQDLADQVTDWAGSDGVIKDGDLAKFKGGDVLYFPTVLAPITLSYNLDVEGLKLTPATVAKIFQGEITTWNDAAIAADNPGVTLPSDKITPAVRSDSSGTTENFTKFLDAAVGTGGDGSWKLKSGSTIQWPAGVQAGNGNSGVAQIVKDTKGGIGYVDLSDAKASGLKFAAVENKAGKFIEPTLDGTSAAAAGATIKDNLTFFAGWADGDAAYPIAAQTWILAYAKQTDAAKALATSCFINYVLTSGQELAPDIDYAPLPADLAGQAITQLDKLQS